MGAWRDFPLPDGSYSDETRPWAQQDVCNYLPTFAEGEGTRSRLLLRTVPGLTAFCGLTGPHRGGRDVEGKMFVVAGTTLYRVLPDGTATSCGTIPGTRRVSMVHNQIDGGNELIIATGDNSYVWNTVTETLTATGIPLVCVDFINQLIVGVDVARRFWRWSGLADATAWNSLDNGSAESSPDRLVWLVVSQGEVLLFGERTIEVWQNSSSGNATFQRSTVIEKGCANGNTVCRLDNTVYFVGNDGIPYRLQGYTPTPIASKAITAQVSQGDPAKLFAFTWEDRGYVVYYLTAQDGQTWGFDVTCQKWHRRESFGLDRWRVNTLFKSSGDWYAGDYSNGKLYRVDWATVYEGCEIMPRSLRAGVMHNAGNRVFIHGLKLLANTGLPSVTCAPLIGGELPDTCDDADYYSEALVISGGTAPFSNVQVMSGDKPPEMMLGIAGDAISATGTNMTAGDYDFWITVDDATGRTSTPFHVLLTVEHFEITGTLPDTPGSIPYSESLTLSGGSAPYVVALTSGALPSGGTVTAVGDALVFAWASAPAGTYTFGGTVTDATGCVATFSESVQATGQWWMTVESTTTARQNKLWTSADALTYPNSTTRTPNINPLVGGIGGPLYAGGGQMIIYSESPEGTCEVEVITDPDVFPITTTIVTVPDDFLGGKLGLFGDTLGAPVNGQPKCVFSADRGATWSLKAGPNADDVTGLGRLSNGRWLCVTGVTGTPKFYYSDVALPASSDWLLASGTPTGQFALWTNGSVGIRFGNDGNVRRTTDGTAWTSAPHGLGAVNPYTGIAFGDTFLIGEDGAPAVLRSTDAGATWARITISGAVPAGSVTKLDRDPISGVIVASLKGEFTHLTQVWVSTDGGASWTQATLPFTPSANDEIRVGFNPNTAP